MDISGTIYIIVSLHYVYRSPPLESWRNSNHLANREAPRARRKVERMSLKLDSQSAV